MNHPIQSLPGDRASRILRGLIGGLVLLALLSLDWFSLAPNRLLPGQPISAGGALGWVAFAVAIFVIAAQAADNFFKAPMVAAALLLGAIITCVSATGLSAPAILADKAPSARLMLGPGFWIVFCGLLILLFEEARGGPRWLSKLLLGGIILALLAGVALHVFDGLSLIVEYRARAEPLQRAFAQHLALSFGALALALVVVVPLGYAAFRMPRIEWAANAVLGTIQVTPSIALFGLLIPLIAAVIAAFPILRLIGFQAIGPAPALIGVAIYLALPLFRGFISGLRAADQTVVEAARAMGLTSSRILREIRIPLALPLLVAALRVATVQSIGLMTLGGLIGAGGLGAIVFEGMAQLASDLILLGALPVIVLGLVADRVLAFLSARLQEPVR